MSSFCLTYNGGPKCRLWRQGNIQTSIFVYSEVRRESKKRVRELLSRVGREPWLWQWRHSVNPMKYRDDWGSRMTGAWKIPQCWKQWTGDEME